MLKSEVLLICQQAAQDARCLPLTLTFIFTQDQLPPTMSYLIDHILRVKLVVLQAPLPLLVGVVGRGDDGRVGARA